MGSAATRSHTVCAPARAVVGDIDEAARRIDAALAAVPQTHGGHWKREPSEAESVVLRKYWGTGRPVSAMARAFGVSENTFRRWAREAGLL